MLYLQFSNLKIRQNPTVRAGSSTCTSIRTPRETETTPGRCHFLPCKSLHNFSCEPILPAGPQSSGISRNIWRGEGKPSRARRGAAMPRVPRGTPAGLGVHTALPDTRTSPAARSAGSRRGAGMLHAGTASYLPAMTAGDLCPPSAFSHTCKVKASRGSSVSAFSRS